MTPPSNFPPLFTPLYSAVTLRLKDGFEDESSFEAQTLQRRSRCQRTLSFEGSFARGMDEGAHQLETATIVTACDSMATGGSEKAPIGLHDIEIRFLDIKVAE